MKRHQGAQKNQERRGAALVEFAVICPVLLSLCIGTIEIGRSMQASTILYGAVREGGRLASMDFADNVGDGETANEKVIRDIRNFITASGLPGDKVTVVIRKTAAGQGGVDFDLEDPDNNLELFRITVILKQSDISIFPVAYMHDKKLRARGVFRAARSSLSS
ncbi:MAG: TadE family protein [Planctomycetaceae bacterium]